MSALFLVLLFFVTYTYLGYPLLLYVWSSIFPGKVKKYVRSYEPFVSIIIAAHNEEINIENRINNLICQVYPLGKLEIIVVSDGSDDRTDIIMKQLESKIHNRFPFYNGLLKFLSYRPMRGKSYAINIGVANATGDIVVFADSRQRFSNCAIKQLVSNFADEQVGCVSGELFIEDISTSGNSLKQIDIISYWEFEKWLRKLESRTGSVPGATGAIYAIRKKLFRTLPEKIIVEDVFIPLSVRMQGFRVAFDSSAVAYDKISKDISLEKKRKIRTLAGNWQLLITQPQLINPLLNPLWFKFLSHKIFRLFVPYCLIILLIIVMCLRTLLSNIILVIMLICIFLTVISPLTRNLGIIYKISKLCKSIIILNFFAFLSPFKFIGYSRKKIW